MTQLLLLVLHGLAGSAPVDVGRRGQHVARGHFCETAAEREEVAKAQELVVTNLAEGLQRLAVGDLQHTINTKFQGEYDKLRGDYNQVRKLYGAPSVMGEGPH